MNPPKALLFFAPLFFAATACGADWSLPSQAAPDKMLREYFDRRVSEIESKSAVTVKAPEEWPPFRERLRREFKEMLGLEPEPPRTDLRPVITGTAEGEGFIVEKLHFQPIPQLYLAANFYRPKEVKEKLPAILYLCGHGKVEKDGVSLGNKTHYHHHGVWFARHGYVCLILDTVQWGEILGEHHGTHRLGRWWWPSRGYTPAGVEAWNAVRALDYLATRSEVDADRFGVTGRSGGGAYTWWVTALDDRVKVAAPTAGITTLRNHVIDGCVEGHCDCMFMQNTYRWDYDRVAALAAPRPLLICNTDKDSIFPLDGVYSIYDKTRRLYRALGAERNIGLHIAEGPHKDTQALNVGAFAWFERHLKSADLMATLDEAAKPSLTPGQLRVFKEIPKDQLTTRIDETFVPKAPAPAVPNDAAEWQTLRDQWLAALQEKVFRGRSERKGADPAVQQIERIPGAGGHRFAHELLIEDGTKLYVRSAVRWTGADHSIRKVRLVVRSSSHDGVDLSEDIEPLPDSNEAIIWFSPRGEGLNRWSGDERKQNQIKRRFLLIGETLEGQQVWDIRQALQAVRTLPGLKGVPITLEATGEMAALALYAAVFEPGIARLELRNMPESHEEGPCLLNVLTSLDLPQALAMAAERTSITLRNPRAEPWAFAMQTAQKLGWKTTLTVEPRAALIDVKKIWDGALHNAFTDLIRRQDDWLCVFREGSGHVPGTDGTIRILRSTDGELWQSAASIAEPGVDLRDPKISQMPDGRLMLLMGGSIYSGKGDPKAHRRFVSARTRVSFSQDGRGWSPPQPISVEDEWLWRVTWHEGVGYGIGYSIRAATGPSLSLWKTRNGTAYERVTALQPPDAGEPNEATIRFDPETDVAYAVVRREKGNGHAHLGRSAPPFTKWTWLDTGRPIQGPNLLCAGSYLFYSGRDYPEPEKTPRTVFGQIIRGKALPLITLPSGGDTSYPGMEFGEDETLWVSYYSSHEGKAAIHLARFRISN
ncbi:MAG: prolyl oligopeptidase family serine peptidase [Verrucomicrobiales bacterium]